MNDNELIEKIINSDSSFITDINNNAKYIICPVNLGKVKMIYGNHFYNSEELNSFKLDSLGIVKDGKFYVIASWYHELRSCDRLNGLIPEFNKEMAEEFYTLFDNLDVSLFKNEDMDKYELEDRLQRREQKARESLLFGEEPDKPIPEYELSQSDLIIILSEETTVKKIASDFLEKNIDCYRYKKFEYQEIQKLIENKDCVDEYEIQIANFLRETCAKTLTVEFTVGEKKGEGKIDSNVIKRNLIYKQDFDYYSFCNKKQGKIIMEQLGIKWDTPKLYCKNITKITYGKKMLYLK